MTRAVRMRVAMAVAAAVAALLVPAADSAEEPAAAGPPLAGIWRAKRRFGPEVRGPLTIERRDGVLVAGVAGRTAKVRVAGRLLDVDLGEDAGAFRGRLAPDGRSIAGHWIQPRTVSGGSRYATPVVLARAGHDHWRGEVAPLDDETTLYLRVETRADGTLGAFLRNPERNLGRFLDADRLERKGDAIRLVAKSGAVLAEGRLQGEALSLFVPRANGTYDFERTADGAASDLFPRGRPGAPWSYVPPPPRADGWSTASASDVGLSREALEHFVRMLVDTPIDSVHAQEVHGVLVARRGRLVLEEYFHGEHGDKLHDTRSAAKSLVPLLAGAARMRGVDVDATTPVYAAMGALGADLDPRKRALTLEHLMTMSGGLDCDDGDDRSKGNEDVMQDQEGQPDWARYTLDLPAVHAPGEASFYCSGYANLAGAVLARRSGRWLPDLFHDLLAAPLGITRYALNLTPSGEGYAGGGARLLPRDFLKLAQLLLNGGSWNGVRVLPAEWCRRLAAPHVSLQGRKYGWFWWLDDYPYRGRTVRAVFAAGNGGQIAMAIPELDLAIAFLGGNYSDPALYVPQRVYVPEWILPAVEPSPVSARR